MRALQHTSTLRGCIKRAAGHQALTAWAAPVRAHRCVTPPPAATRCMVSAASSSSHGARSGSGSGSGSTTNGWLLDTASSSLLGTSPAMTSSSSGNGAGSLVSGGYDAIMMLGGGLLPDGGLPEWVVRRLDGCLHLYEQQVQAARLQALENGGISSSGGDSSGISSSTGLPGAPPIVLLGAGTPHKPPVIDGGGYVLHESTAYADYLLGRGVPAGDLLKEAQSYDTVGNAYFSLLQHAIPAGWRRIAVVTSDFHMPRTHATFDFVYRLAGRQLYGDAAWFDLHFRPVSDEGIFAAEVLEARAEKEAAAVAAWQRNTAPMASLADLHRWLYATHLCYSVSRQHEFGREQPLDPRLAATY